MVRARYCVSINEPGKDDLVYTFYYVAPAFFMARNPTQEEKVTLAAALAARYNPRALQLKAFECLSCGRRARQFIEWLTYALRDPGCLAVNNTLFPACQATSCATKIQDALDTYLEEPSLHQGVVKVGPEIVTCRTCFRDHSDTLPLQACSRCNATLYCSPKCQKIDWKSHKQQCTGRVEAAKLTAKQLAQLDTIMNIRTGGTMELPQYNHPGKLPQVDAEAGIGDMLKEGQDVAIARIAKHAELAKQRKKEEAQLGLAPTPLAVTPQQMSELRDARTDIFGYFGMHQSDQFSYPISAPG